jgi:hypothetical protein
VRQIGVYQGLVMVILTFNLLKYSGYYEHHLLYKFINFIPDYICVFHIPNLSQ